VLSGIAMMGPAKWLWMALLVVELFEALAANGS
jgi:hypothetical protein